uniref:Uncharacterized protein n=1 Tax=Anguilla anguilla TaxID=7936 RepID=A0A0E9WIB9_ANGAN
MPPQVCWYQAAATPSPDTCTASQSAQLARHRSHASEFCRRPFPQEKAETR